MGFLWVYDCGANGEIHMQRVVARKALQSLATFLVSSEIGDENFSSG